MSEKISLPEISLKQLLTLQDELELSQKDLASLSGISQGTVSNILNGHAVKEDSLRSLLQAFVQSISEQGQKGLLKSEQVAEKQNTVKKIQQLTAPVSERLYLARPGGALPPHAANRVFKDNDLQELERTFESGPFSMLVFGPRHSGKSTLLNFITEEAQKKGFLTILLDCKSIVSIAKSSGQSEDSIFLQELQSELDSIMDYPDSDDTLTLASFRRELQSFKQRQPSPPLLIVLDNFSVLNDNLFYSFTSSVIRPLHNLRSNLNTSWCISCFPTPTTDKFSQILSESSGILWNPIIPMPGRILWFSQKQIQDLITVYTISPSDSEVELINSFGGQPFLTHTVISMIADGKSVEQIAAIMYEETGPFLVHCNSLKDSIKRRREHLKKEHSDEIIINFLEEINLIYVDEPDTLWTSSYYQEIFSEELKDDVTTTAVRKIQ